MTNLLKNQIIDKSKYVFLKLILKKGLHGFKTN